jgi:hypothetical protein
MANKERANPSSANVITIVRSPLDSLARVALRYIISSAIDRVRRIAADRSAGPGPSRAATPGARAYGDEAGPDSRGTNRVETDASGLVIRPPSASRMTKHLSLWRRATSCSPPSRMPPSHAPPSHGYARDLRRGRSGLELEARFYRTALPRCCRRAPWSRNVHPI